MADDVDRASDHIERTEAARKTAYEQAAQCRALMPCGVCHWCESAVGAGRIFCPDGSCATDWQRDQDARRRDGR